MRKLENNLSFIQYLISLIILIDLHHIHITQGQGEGSVPEETEPPTTSPTTSPTTEFPKTVSFSISLFMKDASFNDDNSKNGDEGQFTLEYLFRRTLCQCIFKFPDEEQCGEPIQKSSPSPTGSPTTEPTNDPTYDPTTDPTKYPTLTPTTPTLEPTINPTMYPTVIPSTSPTEPTIEPTTDPTTNPSYDPSISPTRNPTLAPTHNPTQQTNEPSVSPTKAPTNIPSLNPTELTSEPTINPTFDPTFDPTFNPTFNPTINPTLNPSVSPIIESSDPTMEPTFIPTGEPTMEPTIMPSLSPTDTTGKPTIAPTTNPSTEPTMEPTVNATSTRRRILYKKNRREILASNDTILPTMMPSQSPTMYTIYDLNIKFIVMVKDKDESDTVYNTIKSYTFFNEYKQCLLDSLSSEYVTDHYNNKSLLLFREEIESMQQSPFEEIDILSPTHSPTSYPTYNYEAGEEYGIWMIVFGICVITAFIAYWVYRRYTIHQQYKEEQRSAPPSDAIELETLFEDSFKD